MTNTELKRRLHLACIIILVVGLFGALLIYLIAGDAAEDAFGYVVVNGTVYAVAPGTSKMYRHQLERYGGKASVILDDFNRWFEGLWQGKSLAKTAAWISVLVALGIYLFANSLPSEPESDGRPEDERDKL